MPKQVKKGHRHDRKVTVRFSQFGFERLTKRQIASGARTPSEYLRHVALTGVEIQMPPWFHFHAAMNEMVKLRLEISRVGKVTPALEDASINAFNRWSRF